LIRVQIDLDAHRRRIEREWGEPHRDRQVSVDNVHAGTHEIGCDAEPWIGFRVADRIEHLGVKPCGMARGLTRRAATEFGERKNGN